MQDLCGPTQQEQEQEQDLVSRLVRLAGRVHVTSGVTYQEGVCLAVAGNTRVD